jgi:hypothetical protein
MKLEINVPVSAFDLAKATQGDQGTYLCQQGGQNFLLVAAAGHSIKSGPTPIGRRIVEAPNALTSPEPWTVTKISNQDVSSEFEARGEFAVQRRD